MTVLVRSRYLFVVLALLLATLALPADAQNLLANPDFDAGVSGWTEANSNVEAIYRGDLGSTLSGGSGPGALEVRFSFWNGGSSGVYQNIPASPGTVYVAGISVYVPSADNPANGTPLVVSFYDSSNNFIDWQVFYLEPFRRDQWVRVGGELTPPAGTTSIVFAPTVQNPADGSETRPGIAYFDDALLAVAGTGSTVQELFYPAAASVAGAVGTFWTTDGWITNQGSTAVKVSGAFLRSGADNTASVAAPVEIATLPPGGSVVLRDLAATLGVSDDTGGVWLRGVADGAGQPLPFLFATSYTSTPAPGSSGGYGQGIPAVAADGGSRTTVAPAAFQSPSRRTNVGVLNTSRFATQVDVTVLDAAGASRASATWSLAPYEHRQVSLPSLGVTSLDGGSVVFVQHEGPGSSRAYVSTVDGETGDAVYVAAQ